MGLIKKIPFSEIDRIEIFINDEKNTLQEIKSKTKADYIMNCGFFDMNEFKPVGILMSEGKSYSTQVGAYGFGFAGGKAIFSYENNIKADEFVSAYPVLLRNGEKYFDKTPVELSGNRGRTAIGITSNDEIVLSCMEDDSGITLEELSEELIAQKCDIAINLDGGGSSQCDFLGEKVTSSRIVHNFLCVYLKNTEKYKVAIDIGHNPNTVNGNEKYNYNEYQGMKKIAEEMQILLEKYDSIDSRIIDFPEETDGKTELNRVISVANEWDADILISLHSNAFSNTSANGYCNFAYSKQSDGYNLGKLIHEETFKEFPEMYDRGVLIESSNYAIIRDTLMPAVLVEQGFHTNDYDISLLINRYKDWAKVNVRGILRYFGIEESNEVSEFDLAKDFCVKNGITDGERPKEYATREEIWTMLYRLKGVE